MQPDIVFVLAGQSNMSGRGDVSPSDAAPTSLPVLVMNMDGTWRRASEPLHAGVDEKELRELAGSPSKPPPGKGPGMMFARRFFELAEAKGVTGFKLGLVPTAVGGTSMLAWTAPGGVLYQSMLKQAEASVSWGAVMGGVLIYQGETDALQQDSAEAYAGELERLVIGCRWEFGYHIPMVVCAITGESRRVPFKEAVRAAQLSAPGRFGSGVACVDCAGLELQEDGLHLSGQAQDVLGSKLAEALFEKMDPEVLAKLKR